MKTLMMCALALLGSAAAVPTFDEFVAEHAKEYKDDVELATRRAIFEANLKVIESHNAEADAGAHSFHMGVTSLSDLTHEEYRSMYTSPMPVHKREGTQYLNVMAPVPDQVDWRTKGFVTPIKNQGQCGSCWAFSTVGSIEGLHKRMTDNLVSLSEQNLVDCAGGIYGNHACNGGLMDNAFRYVEKKGIDTEDAYPYESGTSKHAGSCRWSIKEVGARIGGYSDIAHGNEASLKNACATQGPISVAIDASHASFQQYRSGVYHEPHCSSRSLDHGVLVVGYGTENGEDYWLVKNSWGTSWGEEGYIKMARNADNACGIASQASFPTAPSF